MENKCKRFLSLLLALAMVIGMMPVGQVRAEEGETFSLITEKVSLVKADRTYVICLAGSMKAMTNKQGSGAWNTNTLVTEVLTNKAAETKNMWTLEAAQGGYKIKNGDKYLEVSRNAAELTDDGHVFELIHTNAGWTIKSLATNEYFNNLDRSGSIGGWSGDGTKFDLYKVVEYPGAADPFGKLRGFWTKINVDSEAVGKNDAEGEFWKAFDSNPNTHWHSNYWNGGGDKVNGTGNTIAGEIDLGKEYLINQFSFSPRQDSADSGQVTQASLYVKSAADTEWQLVVQSEAFASDKSKKSFDFEARNVRYVKFVAENANGGWVTVSEFDISGPGIEQPTTANAKILSNNKVISLESCEYVLGAEVNGEGAYVNGKYSLVHNGTYYVKPAAHTSQVPQSKNSFTGLYLNWQAEDDAVHIGGNGGLHVSNENGNIYWDRCGTGEQRNDNDREHDVYLFHADANSTGEDIPGYTKVTSATVKPGDSYLIAAKSSAGEWFVMCPGETENNGGRYAHVAKVVKEFITHEHDLVRTVRPATCTADGLVADSCDICDHYHAIEVLPATGHAPEERAEILPTPNAEGREEGQFCTNCNKFISGGAVIPALTVKNAKPLMDFWRNSNKGVVSLSDCEYVLSGTEGAYSLCHDGTYYVNPDAAEDTGIPQQLTRFESLSLTIDADGGETQISVGERNLQVNNTANAVNLVGDTKYHPWWHDFDANPSSFTTDFYLLKANPNSTNTDIPGYDIVTEVAVGESYLIAFKNSANEWFVMYPSSTETVALAMIVESAGEFEISYSNISMENDLEMHFAFQQDLVENWAGYYAKIEKKYVEGDKIKTDTVTVDVDVNKTDVIKGVPHYYVTYDGVAAKEMTDEFYVTIYNADGKAVSKVYTDTIKAYAHRVLNSDEYTAAYQTVMVDMLNYGTEAQNLWNYNKEKLANADLTADQKNAFVDVSLPKDKEALKTGDFQYKANVNMESNIQFMMAFAGIEKPTKAVVTIDNAKSFETGNFTESAGYYIVTIENTVIADGRLLITCELKNAQDKTIVSVTDSIARYAGRAAESNTANANLYKAMMKFSDSAYTYLNPVQAN